MRKQGVLKVLPFSSRNFVSVPTFGTRCVHGVGGKGARVKIRSKKTASLCVCVRFLPPFRLPSPVLRRRQKGYPSFSKTSSGPSFSLHLAGEREKEREMSPFHDLSLFASFFAGRRRGRKMMEKRRRRKERRRWQKSDIARDGRRGGN